MNRHSLWSYLTVGLPVVLFAAATTARAASIRVPDDAPTIQAAIDLASDGDIVEIAPGTYTGDGNRDISFHGKSLRVQPAGAPHSVLLQVNATDLDLHRGFVFDQGEPPTATLYGLRIELGGHVQGGAILIAGTASPTIESCQFDDNFAFEPWDGPPLDTQVGGGALCIRDAAAPVIRDCVINRSATDFFGSAIYLEGSPSVSIVDSWITNSGKGQAIYVTGAARLDMLSCWVVNSRSGTIWLGASSHARLENCVVADNGGHWAIRARHGATLELVQSTVASNVTNSAALELAGAHASIVRSIVYGNCDVDGESGDLWLSAGSLEIVCCALDPSGIEGDVDLEVGGPHVFADPRFCDPESCPAGGLYGPLGSYSLEAYSSCLPENNLCGEQIGALGMGCGTTSAIGACCLAGNECVITTALNCGVRGGEFKGDGTSCEGSPCGEGTPAEERSWGEIKARYR